MKEHPLYPGYMITPEGDVYSCVKLRRRVGVVGGCYTVIDYTAPVKLTPTLQSSGYVVVGLGKYKLKLIHRLVAQTYLDNPYNYAEVNHLDKDKANNNVCNLEWCNRQQNAEHGLSKHYRIEHIPTGEIYEVYNLSAFCREHNLHRGSLGATIYGKKRNHYKGYRVIHIY